MSAKKHTSSANSLTNINLLPLDNINGFDVRPGIYEINGATVFSNCVNFTIRSKGATGMELLLFHRTERKPYAVLPFPDSYRIGNVYSMMVFDLDIEEFEYAYRADGPWDPENGLRFSRKNILLDIYARAVTGQSVWGTLNPPGSFYKARVVRNNFDWGLEANPRIPMEDLVIYELHVRGFTRHPSSGVACPGTFAGLKEKIPYLLDLGVNAVELMPIFEFDEMKDARVVDGHTLLDYWGYNPVSFFSPNTSYSSSLEYNREGTELKELIRELNNHGIECFLDVVFNHTAEGDSHGPCFSLKGFDNNIYYMLTPDGSYYNFSGCGNTVNCSHPMVQQLILECLRYWTTAYHVDGFRFDLASILGRNQDGTPLKDPPMLQQLSCDPILADVKLIAEAWDAGGLYQVGTFPAWNRWAEWNGRYRDDMRGYLRGNLSLSHAAGDRMAGSPDLYADDMRDQNASVNFLNCHDGFTLWDLYSYNSKHNEGNGWNNTDGSNDNRSWNCGAEGPTDDPEINALRRRLCRNAMAVLMTSRGTPMFLAGDEFLNSQGGNNNGYCQDNEISWLNWEDLERNQDQYRFTRHMIRIRKAHPVLRKKTKPCSMGFADITVYEPEESTRALRILYAGKFEDGEDDLVFVVVNPYWEEQACLLPPLPEHMYWQVEANTQEGWYLQKCVYGRDMPDHQPVPVREPVVNAAPRSVMVLTPGKM